MNKYDTLFWLQMFADAGEGDGGADGANGAGSGNAQEQTQQHETLSFDDFLNQEGNQAEFDRRIQKAIQTALANERKKQQKLADDRVSEAERLAQMSAEEKATYRADKAKKELEELKRQIAMGDMITTARKMLSDEQINLPDDIIRNLVSDDAEKTKSAVESFAKIYKEAVQAAVKSSLSGPAPRAGGSSKPITRDEILAVKNKQERQRLIAQHPELFTLGGK